MDWRLDRHKKKSQKKFQQNKKQNAIFSPYYKTTTQQRKTENARSTMAHDPVNEVFTNRINPQFVGLDAALVQRLFEREHEYLLFIYDGVGLPHTVTEQHLVDTMEEARAIIGRRKKFVIYNWYTLWGPVVVRVGQV